MASSNIADTGSDLGSSSPLNFNRWTFSKRRRAFLVLLSLPAVFYILVIGMYPLAKGIGYSFFQYNLLRPARTEFIGFGNYIELMSDPDMQMAVLNTCLFTFFSVSFQLVLGLALALALWQDNRFNRICLTLVLIPVTITPLVVGLIFKGLLLADFGQIGYYLAQWGLSSPRGLLADSATALPTLIFIDVWEWTPLVTLILLAGLKSLPGDVIEAAAVDGASYLRTLRSIILPLMLPAIMLAITLRTIDAFRIFDSVYVTTSGGPGNATNTLMYYAVKEGLSFFNIGKASAISNVMLLLTAAIATTLIVMIRKADQKANGQ